MIKSIRGFAFLLFRKLIPINWLIQAIEDEKLKAYEKSCIKEQTAILHKDARIINLQNNPYNIRIGKQSLIRGELFINQYGGKIEIGNWTSLGEHSRIWSGESVLIGNNVHISHGVNIIDTNTHSLDVRERQAEYVEILTKGNITQKGNIKTAPIRIEDNVWISFNVTILKGVTIGEGAIVAANSLVTKNVPPFTMVAGSPAEVIKTLN